MAIAVAAAIGGLFIGFLLGILFYSWLIGRMVGKHDLEHELYDDDGLARPFRPDEWEALRNAAARS